MKYVVRVKGWKAFLKASAILCILFLHVGNLAAQSARIVHKITMQQKDPGAYLGRDLWLTMCKNYDNQGGKYYNLYITSPNNTTVYIQVTGGSTSKYPITAGQVITFSIPLSWEVTSSGEVENKGIRVWSNDADLTVYLLSRNPYTSDGMFIIPTIGWGKDYIVGAFHSLYEGYGTFVYDYPSECSIVANQDNTICTITPSCDIRASGAPTVVLHKKNQSFTEILNRGQCVQYMATQATDADNFDVTGTHIISNNPVGVVGASQCPNIPVWYPYCDHICDMIPPIRTWAQTYQSVPFAHRTGGDTYLVISSVPGQTIMRNHKVYAVLTNQYESYFRYDISDASLWESSAPFMLAQYINSDTWENENGTPNAGHIGDPAMVVVNSVEQYVPHIIFQTPNIQGSNGFQNFANVMIDTAAIKTTKMDGKSIASYPNTTQMPIPYSNYMAFRIASVSPGKHEIVSTSGVGVYIYGYGFDDSYAWNGSLGLKTYHDPDTIPPVARTSGNCFDALVTMTDNHIAPPASKISEMKLDSIYNMVYAPDPNYQIGIASDSTYYNMSVIDNSKEALLKIEAHDYAGNQTIVTSTYTPQSATLTPPLNNYGAGNIGVKTWKYFTVTNTGTKPYSFQYIKLLLGTQGFSIDSLIDPSPIPVGGSRRIKIGFRPATSAAVHDTLELFDGCPPALRAVVIGTGGDPDFAVFGEDFQCQLVGTKTKLAKATVNNSSKSKVTVDNIWVDDVTHFGFSAATPVGNNLPFDLGPNEQRYIEFSFTPDKVGSYSTIAHFHSTQIGERTAELLGCGVAPGAHIYKDTLNISDCANAVPFVFTVTDTGNYKMIIDKVVVVGDPQFSQPTSFSYLNGSPTSLPVQLDPAREVSFLAYLNFIPGPKASGTFKANVFAIGPNAVTGLPDTTNLVTATVKALYRELNATQPAINIPAVPFGSPAKNADFQYCNDLDDAVTMQSVVSVPGPYSNAFTIVKYSVGGAAKTLPITLNKGECVNITVQFDPSVSPDSVQKQNYAIVSDACITAPAGTAFAGVTLGPPTIQGFALTPAILSCDTKTSNVGVTNSNPVKSPAMTITNIAVQGANAASFAAGNPASMLVSGGSTMQIPVTFSPTPSPGGPAATLYNANVVVTMKDATGNIVTLTAPVSGSANGMSAVVSSQFAIADQSAVASSANVVKLPINIAFTRNGLPDPIDAFGITTVKLVYNYNPDILELVGGNANIANSVFGLPAGWKVDPAPASNMDNATGTLTLSLSGPVLNDAQATAGSLGEIRFYPTLAKSGTKTTTVILASSDLLTAGGASVGGCLGISQKSTQFSLVYSCGDSTLAYYLKNGNAPSMIKPANPNPVSSANGGIVNFQYVTKHEGIVSLTIYDELGKEVARVVTGQYHPAGTYEVRYDASRLSSGSYIYRFQLDNDHAISNRMVVSN